MESVVAALGASQPEALVRLLDSADGGNAVEPSNAQMAALFDAVGLVAGKKGGAYKRRKTDARGDVLRRAAACATAARRGFGAARAAEDCACFDARFRAELPAALERLAAGEAVDCAGVADEDARGAFEHVLQGYGLRAAPRDDLGGAPGYAADGSATRDALRALAAALAAAPEPRRRAAPVGPARPVDATSVDAASAAAAASSDDDDDVGPLPTAAAELEARGAPARRKRPAVADDHGGWTTAADGGRGDCGGRREGWMMVPPSASELSALGKDGLPPAKSAFVAKAPAPRQKSDAELAAIAERRAADRAARGPALVDTFQAAPKAAPAGKKPGGFNFSREDMGARRMDPKQAAELISQARQLDSRFDSSTQTSFL